jgi:hypothetical protein
MSFSLVTQAGPLVRDMCSFPMQPNFKRSLMIIKHYFLVAPHLSEDKERPFSSSGIAIRMRFSDGAPVQHSEGDFLLRSSSLSYKITAHEPLLRRQPFEADTKERLEGLGSFLERIRFHALELPFE